MDLLGLLEAAVALALYPGAVYVGAAAWLLRRGAALGREGPFTMPGAAAVAAAIAAAALAPLPGSPVTSLPPVAGAAPNALVCVLLFAGAVALARGVAAPATRAAGMAALVAVAAALAAAGTLSLPAVTASGAILSVATRAAAALTLLLALPRLTGVVASRPDGARTIVAATGCVLALSLVVPPRTSAAGAVLTAAAVLAATALYGLLLRAAPRLVAYAGRGASVAAIVSVALAIGASR